jgi:hypothetical protein
LAVGNPYRAVREYGTHARTPRARGRLAHAYPRDERIAASCCTAVIATTRVRGACAALFCAALVSGRSPSSPLTSAKEANGPQRCPEPIPPRFETSGQLGNKWQPHQVCHLRETASKGTVFRVSKVARSRQNPAARACVTHEHRAVLDSESYY